MYAWSVWRNGSNVGSGWGGAVVGGSVGPQAAIKTIEKTAAEAGRHVRMQLDFANRVPARLRPSSYERVQDDPEWRRRVALLQCRQHGAHAVDFGALVGFDVGDEAEDVGFLRRAGRVEQVVHHLERAAVMLDHPFEKQTVELRPFRLFQLLHLVRGQHSRHEAGAVQMQLG